jgi:hypothetical protein
MAGRGMLSMLTAAWLEPTDLVVCMEGLGRMEGMVVKTAEGTLLSEEIIVFILIDSDNDGYNLSNASK